MEDRIVSIHKSGDVLCVEIMRCCGLEGRAGRLSQGQHQEDEDNDDVLARLMVYAVFVCMCISGLGKRSDDWMLWKKLLMLILDPSSPHGPKLLYT